MSEKLEQLKTLLAEVADLNATQAVLGWDQQTYMPKGGNEAIDRIGRSRAQSGDQACYAALIERALDAEQADGSNGRRNGKTQQKPLQEITHVIHQSCS